MGDRDNTGVGLTTITPRNSTVSSESGTALTRLSASHDALKVVVSDLSSSHYDLSTNHSDLSSSHYALKGTIGDLSTSHYALKSTVGDLSGSHYALKSTIGDLSSSHYALKSTVGDLSSSHYALKSTIGDLSSSHYALKSTVGDLSGSHYALKSTIGDLSTSHYALKSTVGDLSGSHYALKSTIGDLSSSHYALKSTIGDLSSSHYALKGTVGDLSSSHYALKSTIGDLSSSHYALKGTVGDLSSSHYALKSTIGDLSSNNNIRFNNIDTSLSQVYTKTQSDSIFVSKSNIDLSNLSTNIIPSTDNTYKIGDVSKNWRNAYIKDISATNIDISNKLNVFGPTQLNNTLNVAGNVTLNGSTLYAPSTFTIDPYGHDNNTGTLFINGNLTVQGLTTTINSSVVDISDKKILLASNAKNSIEATGAGFEISGANVNFIYDYPSNAFSSSIGLSISGNVVPANSTNVNLGVSGNIWKIAYIDELNVNSFTNSINGANITSETITSTQIMNGTIVDGDISNSAAIAFRKINASLAIMDSDISTNAAIQGSKIASETITSTQIMNGTILGTDISNDTITSANIRDGSILTGDICDNAITFDKLAYNSVGNTRIINLAVTHEKLSSNCVQSHNIADGTIVDGDISANANILGSKLANNSITSDKINQSNNWTFSQLTSNTANIRDISTTNISISGNIIPLDNSSSDLGSLTKRWRNIFVNDLSVNTINGQAYNAAPDLTSVSGNIIPSLNNTFRLGDTSRNWSNAYIRDISASNISISGNFIPLNSVIEPQIIISTTATGGIMSNDGTYIYHIFTTVGTTTFTVTSPGLVDYLVIGGGGGGGVGGGGGGGGAGGVRFGTTTLPAASYTITVGAGGGGTGGNGQGYDGGSSSIGILIDASGGGGGGGWWIPDGRPGGSGGGQNARNGGTSGGSGIAGQGFAGASYISGSNGGGGGGGGGTGSGSTGGIGITSNITGITKYYAGGGGGGGAGGSTGGVAFGGTYTVANGTYGGGNGAGSNGFKPNFTDAVANTGGGGGGNEGGNGPSGSGGSGIVVIRYSVPTIVPAIGSNLGLSTKIWNNAYIRYITTTCIDVSTNLNPLTTNTGTLGTTNKIWSNAYIRDISASNIEISGNILPLRDISSDLGSLTKRWRNIYVNDLSVSTINGQAYSAVPNLTSVTTNIIPSTVNSNLTLGNTTNTWSNAYIRDISATNISVSGDILPLRDISSDLGSLTKRWRNIYVNDLSVSTINGQAYSAVTAIDLTSVSGNIIPYADNTFRLGDASRNWSNAYIRDISASNISISGNIIFNISGGSMRIAADASTNSITSTHRIYQNINGGINDPSWSSVNGYYGLAKDAYPRLNPYSSGAKAVQTWTGRTSALDNNFWHSICWSPQLAIFVVIAYSEGSSIRVMTSPDGITWTSRASPSNGWVRVCWSPERMLFVAVAVDGTNRVMTSPNGITWTGRASSNESSSWYFVCWSKERSLFVAVANGGTSRVMTSPDGISWTGRVSSNETNTWNSVCWSPQLGLFVAVAYSGTNSVMTSPNGITWTGQTSANDANQWYDVCWSPELGLFVAVATEGGTDRVMTSPNGTTWTGRSVSSNGWQSVCWSPELGIFVAVGRYGASPRVMYSFDGITWTGRTSSNETNNWLSVCWSPERGIFVAVASGGTNRVMTSSLNARPPTSYNVFDSSFNRIDESGNWTFSAIDISTNLNPTIPNSGSLGLSNKRWANAFVNDLSVSTINGQAYSATTAIDLTSVSGNIIPSLNNTFRLGDTSRNWSNAYIRDISASNIEISGNILPLRDISSDLGSSLKRWRNIFVNDLSVNTINGQAYSSGGGGTAIDLTSVSGNIIPSINNTFRLGDIGKNWSNAYVSNLTGSNIIGETLNARHSTQNFGNNLWNQLGQDISNMYFENNKKVVISNDGRVTAMSSSTYDLSNATNVGIVYVYELSYNQASYTWLPLGSNNIIGISGDELGFGLALSSNGRIVAASSLYSDVSGINSGQVKIFELSNNLWTPLGNVINGKPRTNYQSGYSLNLSGNGKIISISSLKGDSDLSYGEVRVYELSSNNIWIQKGIDICGTVIGSSQGYSSSLSLDGTTLAIGCDVGNNNNIGQVKVFRFSTNNWNNIGTIQGPQLYLNTISATSTSIRLGNTLNYGQPGEYPLYEFSINYDGTVIAYTASDYFGTTFYISVFKYTTSWVRRTLITFLPTGEKQPENVCLSQDGNILSVTTRRDDPAPIILIYRYNEISLAWTQIGRILAYPTYMLGSGSVYSTLSADGKVVAIAIPKQSYTIGGTLVNDVGYVRVLRYDSDMSWVQIGQDISGTSAIKNFAQGIALSISGEYIVCTTSDHLSNRGIARVYRYSPNMWTLIGDISGPVANKSFGVYRACISSDGKTIAVGSFGYVYVYKYINDMNWIQSAALQGNINFYYVPYLSYDGTTALLGRAGTYQNNYEFYISNKVSEIWKYTNARWIKIFTGVAFIGNFGFDESALSGDGSVYMEASKFAGTSMYKLTTNYVSEYAENLSYATNKNNYLNLFFGRDVKLSSDGNKIVIGATGPNGLIYNENPYSYYRYNQGSVWIYQYQGTGTTWNQLGQTIHGESTGDEFGSNVSITNDGSIISIGSNNNSSNRGHVKVYKYWINSWMQLANTINGKTINANAGINSLAGDGTTLIQTNNTYNTVYGINCNLSIVSPITTISGDLAISGKIYFTNDLNTNNLTTTNAYIRDISSTNISISGNTIVNKLAAISTNSYITTTHRIYQEISGDISWNTVNGYYALAKSAYPSLDPLSSSVKAVQTWTSRTTPSIPLISICWSAELGIFLAVANGGSLPNMASSIDGINWILQSPRDAFSWTSVCWSPELRIFVAITYNAVQYSSNGIFWNRGNVSAAFTWSSICWSAELGIFVAVSQDGNTQRVMTSSNALTWVARIAAQSNTWNSVCWSAELGIFVAVASDGTNRVMTSNNGIDWIARTAAQSLSWKCICWSRELGIFVAVAGGGVINCVMTSNNGINWTSRLASEANTWTSVSWSKELGIFVAVSQDGNNRVMASNNGITWTSRPAAQGNLWNGICWSPELGIFAAVSTDGTNRVMTSSLKGRPPTSYNVFDNSFNSIDQSGNWTFTAIDVSTNLNPRTPLSGSVGTTAKPWGNAVIRDLSVTTINGQAYSAATAIDLTSVSGNIIPASNVNFRLGDTSRNWSNAYIRDISATNISISGNIMFSISGGSMRIAADTSTNSITTSHRIYQNISGGINDLSWASVNGYYGLAKDAYPALNPLSSGAKVVSNWTRRIASSLEEWLCVCWSPELRIFVAVGESGTNRVMTSPDGITWTGRSVPQANAWLSVCWAPELRIFVAVATTGTNCVMTSPDGITWTARTPIVNRWWSVCWSAQVGLFVAVADTGPNYVMSSPDGITWTGRTVPETNLWNSVCWSPQLGLFVAVAYGGTDNRVMTSPNGINWTAILSAETNPWRIVCWSAELGLFAAFASTGTNRVMTSNNGTTWTARLAATNSSWWGACWSAEVEQFVVVASSGQLMTSSDGITWTSRTPAQVNVWRSICWSPELGIFAAIAGSGTNRVMTSSLKGRPPTSYNVFDSSFNAIDESGNWTFQNIDISGNIIPLDTSSSDLGSSTKRWRNIFVNDLSVSTINGQAYSATPAIDLTSVSGNIIPYADNTFRLGDTSRNWSNAYIRDISASNIEISGNILPLRDISSDLGSLTKRWRNIFVNDLSVSTINGQAYSATPAIDLTSVSGNIIPSLNNTFRLGDTSRNWSNAYIRDISASNIEISGNILPLRDISSDLGSITKRWRNIYVNDLSVSTINGQVYNPDAPIQGSKIASETITSTQIMNGTIVDGDISANANILGSKLANNSITSDKIDQSNNWTFSALTVSGTSNLSSTEIRGNVLPKPTNTHLLGDGNFWWFAIFGITLHFFYTVVYSDDRLKHNEAIIINGLEIIDKLTPKFYQKTLTMLDADYNGDLSGHTWSYEAGLIAQEVLQIPDLSFCVSGGDRYDESNNLIKEPYGVNYNNIFVYGLAAIKELHTKVKAQETIINSLISRIELLEKH